MENRLMQNFEHGLVKSLPCRRAQVIAAQAGMDAGQVQNLAGVQIADAGQCPLV